MEGGVAIGSGEEHQKLSGLRLWEQCHIVTHCMHGGVWVVCECVGVGVWEKDINSVCMNVIIIMWKHVFGQPPTYLFRPTLMSATIQ